jgi:hypothetical protein
MYLGRFAHGVPERHRLLPQQRVQGSPPRNKANVSKCRNLRKVRAPCKIKCVGCNFFRHSRVRFLSSLYSMNAYYFGHLVPTINVFAYPRTGSHFLHYCLSGLFDLVSFSHPHLDNEEAINREKELNPEVLYMLGLRDPQVPWQPIYFNPLSTGTHGLPAVSKFPSLVLIRDPIATAYSRYRVERDRWGGVTTLTTDWLRIELLRYSDFYRQALNVLADLKQSGLLVRWEDLVAGPNALERVIAFTRHPPKLRPLFVWSATQFANFVQPGNRTFYRSGSSDAWRSDSEWVKALSRMESLSFSFEVFGYTSIAERLATTPLRADIIQCGSPTRNTECLSI